MAVNGQLILGTKIAMIGTIEAVIPEPPQAKLIRVSPWGVSGDIEINGSVGPGVFGQVEGSRTGHNITIRMLYQPGAADVKLLLKLVADVNSKVGHHGEMKIKDSTLPEITYRNATFHGFFPSQEGWINDLVNGNGYWVRGEARAYVLLPEDVE